MLIVVVVISGRPACFVCHLGTHYCMPSIRFASPSTTGTISLHRPRNGPAKDRTMRRHPPQTTTKAPARPPRPSPRKEALSKFLFHSLLSFSLLRFPAADVISGILKIIVSSSGLATLSLFVLSPLLSPALSWSLLVLYEPCACCCCVDERKL